MKQTKQSKLLKWDLVPNRRLPSGFDEAAVDILKVITVECDNICPYGG